MVEELHVARCKGRFGAQLFRDFGQQVERGDLLRPDRRNARLLVRHLDIGAAVLAGEAAIRAARKDWHPEYTVRIAAAFLILWPHAPDIVVEHLKQIGPATPDLVLDGDG